MPAHAEQLTLPLHTTTPEPAPPPGGQRWIPRRPSRTSVDLAARLPLLGKAAPVLDLRGARSMELCAGFGGLALGTEFVTGAETTVVAEVHPEACKIMAERFPSAPNLGDAKSIPWEEHRGEVDVMSCGFPCQDISQAGLREGIKGARSGLWFDIARALEIIHPEYVFLENVAAIRTRGLAAVLSSLHEIRYNVWWGIIGADDIGAPHIRKRWFAVATPAPSRRRRRPESATPKLYGSFDPDTYSWRTPDHAEIGDSKACKHQLTKWGSMQDGELLELPAAATATGAADGPALAMLPTVRAADGNRGPTWKSTVHEGSDDLVTVLTRLFRENSSVYEQHPEWLGAKPKVLFKTPTANLGTNGAAQPPQLRKAGGHGPTLDDEVCFLLSVTPEDSWDEDGPFSPAEWWNEFLPAIRRWECITRSPAPIPVIRGPRGGVKVNPRFVEWMMGLPQGWVTEVKDVPLGEQISRLGNGVVPVQSATAFTLLIEAKNALEADAYEDHAPQDEPYSEIGEESLADAIERVAAMVAKARAQLASPA